MFVSSMYINVIFYLSGWFEIMPIYKLDTRHCTLCLTLDVLNEIVLYRKGEGGDLAVSLSRSGLWSEFQDGRSQ